MLCQVTGGLFSLSSELREFRVSVCTSTDVRRTRFIVNGRCQAEVVKFCE